jgi:hypothetical protein
MSLLLYLSLCDFYIYIYIYIYLCVCVCVCVCLLSSNTKQISGACGSNFALCVQSLFYVRLNHYFLKQERLNYTYNDSILS